MSDASTAMAYAQELRKANPEMKMGEALKAGWAKLKKGKGIKVKSAGSKVVPPVEAPKKEKVKKVKEIVEEVEDVEEAEPEVEEKVAPLKKKIQKAKKRILKA